MSAPPTTQGAAEGPFAASRGFWPLIGMAILLGVFGALFSLAFMWVVAAGGDWYAVTDPGWMGGQWWWVAVTAGAGLLVGVLHRVTRLPGRTQGLIEDLQQERVETRDVVGVVVVSAASLIGGASVGPEKALGAAGGGVGDWLARRRRADEEDRKVATLSGFAGAYGGLFSSTAVVVMMILEIVRPGGRHMTKVLVTTVLASSVSFGVYFAFAGAVFLDAYALPTYQVEDWHMVAAIGIGIVAAIVVSFVGVTVLVVAKAFDALRVPSLAKPVIGGAIFGLIGVALPLTMFTGSAQLGLVIQDGTTLGLGLLVLLVLAKAVAFAVSLGSGFVGGPIFPALFIGGTMGVALHLVIPELPLGLTFTCMLAAVPGGLVAAPFTFVLLAAFFSQVGALNIAPILVAVVTAWIVTEAIRFQLARRRGPAAPPEHAGP